MTNYHGKIILTLCTIKWLDLLALFIVLDIGTLSCELSKMMYFAFVYSHLCYGIEINGNTYHSYLNKFNLIIKYSEYYRMNPIAHMLQNFMKTITPFQFQNSTIEFCQWFINLPTITANYLLYFKHTLMIINYFMNIVLVGKNCFT